MATPKKPVKPAIKSDPKTIKAAAAKGSGKIKYKNTIKEARVNTVLAEKMDRLMGKKLTKSESQARTRSAKNLPKQIAKEEKIRTGVNTAKPTTPKIPVKPRGGRGGMGGGGFFGGSPLRKSR
jgi:hypothetical protein